MTTLDNRIYSLTLGQSIKISGNNNGWVTAERNADGKKCALSDIPRKALKFSAFVAFNIFIPYQFRMINSCLFASDPYLLPRV